MNNFFYIIPILYFINTKSTYNSCKNKNPGDLCKLCDPHDINCIEILGIKRCSYDNICELIVEEERIITNQN